MKKGLFIGKFLPLHLGHIFAIQKSATMCDELTVVLDVDREEDRKLWKNVNARFPSGKIRYRWLLETFNNLPHVKIKHYEFGNIFRLDGWELYVEKLVSELGFVPDMIFTSVVEYKEGWENTLPNCQVVLLDPDRKVRHISGKKMRENLYENWHWLSGAARRHLSKVVVITGTESCGKTTLTKYLQKLYNTSYVEEVGRTIWEDEYFGNDKLTHNGAWFKFGYHQLVELNHARHTANKIVVMDTDAVVTQFYYLITKLGEDEIERSIQYDESVFNDIVNTYEHKGIKEVIKEQQFLVDKFILLKPTVKWINDGYRNLGQQKTRDFLYIFLKKMYLYYGYSQNDIVEFGGDYQYRLDMSINTIDNLIINKNGSI